jgi:hypothetical protein
MPFAASGGLVHISCSYLDWDSRDAVRNKDGGRSGPGLFDRITDIGKNRESEMCFSSLLWVCATNNLGSWEV